MVELMDPSKRQTQRMDFENTEDIEGEKETFTVNPEWEPWLPQVPMYYMYLDVIDSIEDLLENSRSRP